MEFFFLILNTLYTSSLFKDLNNVSGNVKS